MEEQITTGQVSKKWGLIYGLLGTIIGLVPLILEMQAPWITIVNIALAIVMYLLAMKEFKTANGGYMTFGEGFRIAIVAALISGVIRCVINYVYVKFVDTDVMIRMQSAMEDVWRDQCRASLLDLQVQK